MPLVFKNDFGHIPAAAASNEEQSGKPTFDNFMEELGPYISIKASNVDFQLVQRLRFIGVGQRFNISPQKKNTTDVRSQDRRAQFVGLLRKIKRY